MTDAPKDPQQTQALVFGFFREIGILNQLSSAMLAAVLPEGVHPSHFAILMHLANTGSPKTPARITSAMQVTKTTMTHSLKVLEGHGFVDIAPNPNDARGKLVSLTGQGLEFLERAQKEVAAKFGPLFGPEHHDIMARLFDDLHGLRVHMDENR